MTILRPIRIDNFEGGLSLTDDTLIKDNQLSKATNFFYNNQKQLQTRYGQISFGHSIADAITQLSLCDVATNWAVSEDGATLTAENTLQKRGAGALKFNISVAGSANNYALLTNSALTSADITLSKGYIGFWLYAPVAFTTELTNVVLRIGSDSTNYYEFTFLPASITAASWNFLHATYASATITGIPVDTALTYAQVRINYTASYTDKTGVMIDDIVSYSEGYSKPMMSIKFFKEGVSPFTRHLITNVGTNVFEYDETSGYWTLIKSGTTNGARYSATMYKDVMYFTNGVDNYASWNGRAWTEHTGANTYKGKYMLLANDIGYIMGDPTAPSSLGYTTATPANLQSFPSVLVLDDDSSDGIGTGLINLGPIVIASKNKKIYKVNVATPTREQLDYSDGNSAGRAFCRVENEVFLLNDSGVYTLAQREATTGSLRASSLSDDLQPLIDSIKDKTTASAFYNNANNNFYLFFDESGDGIHDTCIVFSILTKKWTKYTNVNANEMVKYEDANGDQHLLIANSGGGVCKEIEVGYNDNGNPILYELETKNWDFDQPETLKTFEIMEIHGFINSTGVINVVAITDDNIKTPEATILGSNYDTSSSLSSSLGAFVLGGSALGGDASSSSSGVVMYPFKVRIPMYMTGSRIKIKLYSQELNSSWILSKISVYPFPQPLEVYPESQIL